MYEYLTKPITCFSCHHKCNNVLFIQWGITALRDNYLTDEQFYLIKVYTGMRRGAGTMSRIAFILTGSRSGSGPRELFDGIREVQYASN